MDEHGHDIPDRYQCPVCSIADRDAFMRCYHPNCPDGCDQKGRFPTYPSAPQERKPSRLLNIIVSATVALIVSLSMTYCHQARGTGVWPAGERSNWFQKLIRPDTPPNSCCGIADGYPVDSYKRLPDGDYEVHIEDCSGAVMPDGRLRMPCVGHETVTVDRSKVNPEIDDLDNPTGRSWLFWHPNTGTIYCFGRHPMGT
jgi:hypothetical protein